MMTKSQALADRLQTKILYHGHSHYFSEAEVLDLANGNRRVFAAARRWGWVKYGRTVDGAAEGYFPNAQCIG